MARRQDRDGRSMWWRKRQSQNTRQKQLLAEASRSSIGGDGDERENEQRHRRSQSDARCHQLSRSSVSEVTLNDPTPGIFGFATEGRSRCPRLYRTWHRRTTSEEERYANRQRERGREEAHHDIFCFPTQMAISSTVRALLSSVQVGEGKAAGARREEWIGPDARRGCRRWRTKGLLEGLLL